MLCKFEHKSFDRQHQKSNRETSTRAEKKREELKKNNDLILLFTVSHIKETGLGRAGGGEGARIVFNLCFVKVIMRDYRFGSMAEISRLTERPLRLVHSIFFGPLRWGCGRAPLRILLNFSLF